MIEEDMQHEEILRHLRDFKKKELERVPSLPKNQISESYRLNERLSHLIFKLTLLEENGTLITIKRPQSVAVYKETAHEEFMVFLDKIEETANPTFKSLKAETPNAINRFFTPRKAQPLTM